MRQKSESTSNRERAPARLALGAGLMLLLSACGGGGSDAASSTGAESAPQAQPPTADVSFSTVTLSVDATSLPSDVGDQSADPVYHLAPVLLDAPGDSDANDNNSSALAAPHTQAVSSYADALETRGLTVQALREARRTHALSTSRALADGNAAPLASTSAVTTYTPAQIRAAYALPTMPSAGLTPTAAQAAQLGAGQTIYIIDAMHDPNAAAELAVFNAKFGLPVCTTKSIASSTALPLAAAAVSDGCTFSVAYSTASGAMISTAPAYNAGWATEIALDVQWAHAIAPLARIVLIESPDSSLNSLLGAVKLANSMGSGVVSMSFGAAEGGWTASADSAFAAAGMSYLAATGDSGAGVSWPAVSSNVLAVGGTSLTYNGLGPRSETAWAKSGGGISSYVATPAYQSNKVPGVGTLAHRAVADVSFNADPATGQYVTVITPGSGTASWVSAGGTSLSTPQWAGLTAIANAMRVQAGQARLGAPHAMLYSQFATVPGTYAATFADVLIGANGTCASCAAKVGYDIPTGLGTPNAGALLSAMSGSATASVAPAAPVAPVVAAASVTGKAGTALSVAVTLTAGSASSFSLTDAPSGMVISNNGVVTWAAPVAGTYSVTVNATNGASGLVGKGILTVVIAKAPPPTVTAPALTGTAGRALTGAIVVSDPAGGGLQVTITGVPAGVSFVVNGQTLLLSWPNPVAGKYSLGITARNGAGLSTTLAMPIIVNPK